MPASIILKSHAGRQTATTTVARKPLGDITHTIIHKNTISDPKESMSGKKYSATNNTTLDHTEAGSHDHKGQLIASLDKALKLVTIIQQNYYETFDACQHLINTLNQLHGLVDALYLNATWFHHSPPNALNQTLRRLRNWALSVSRSETSDPASSSKIDAFTVKLKHVVREIAID